jgi:type VI secretion system protein ImpF
MPPSALGLLPSVLDRLTDAESAGTEFRQGYSVAQMAEVVRRDLEDLLNTRRPPADMLEGLEQVRRSVVNFGLPDFSRLDPLTAQQRNEIAKTILDTITVFEPRLQRVRVTLADQDPKSTDSPQLKYLIDAKLVVDPAPAVAFDTILQLTKGFYQVKRRE